jgi:hypothetical protein
MISPKHLQLKLGEKPIISRVQTSITGLTGYLYITNLRLIFASSCGQSIKHYAHKNIKRTEGQEPEGGNGFFGNIIKIITRNDQNDSLGYTLYHVNAKDTSDMLNEKFYNENVRDKIAINSAKEHEKLLEFDEAASVYKELGMVNDAIRVRKLKAEQGAVRVDQTVIHGDQITKTEIKDSVLNRSNVGADGDKSKSEELRDAKALLDDGIIDNDEFKQMKKEILGK